MRRDDELHPGIAALVDLIAELAVDEFLAEENRAAEPHAVDEQVRGVARQAET